MKKNNMNEKKIIEQINKIVIHDMKQQGFVGKVWFTNKKVLKKEKKERKKENKECKQSEDEIKAKERLNDFFISKIETSGASDCMHEAIFFGMVIGCTFPRILELDWDDKMIEHINQYIDGSGPYSKKPLYKNK